MILLFVLFILAFSFFWFICATDPDASDTVMSFVSGGFISLFVVGLISTFTEGEFVETERSELFSTPTLEFTGEILFRDDKYYLYKDKGGIVKSVSFSSFEVDSEATQPYEATLKTETGPRWYRFNFSTTRTKLFLPTGVSLKLKTVEAERA